EGGWLQSQGCVLSGPAELLRQRPIIRLRGPNGSAGYLGGRLPGVRATVPPAAGSLGGAMPSSLSPEGDDYVLEVTLAPRGLPEHGPVEVRLSFDRWFVPKELGLNEDTRQLVIPAPHSLSLHPAPPVGAGG